MLPSELAVMNFVNPESESPFKFSLKNPSAVICGMMPPTDRPKRSRRRNSMALKKVSELIE